MALYSKIDRRIWIDSKFRSLSQDAKWLWFYLLTCPENGSMPGLLRLGKAAIAEALEWLPERLPKPFGELTRNGMAKANWEARFVYLPNALRYNAPPNPNVVASWSDHWDNLPECDLKNEAFEAFSSEMKRLGEPFAKRFAERLAKPSALGIRIQEQDQEQDQDPSGGQTPPAPATATELKLDGEPESAKPANQKKLPLPKPIDPTGEAMSVWRKLWSEKYQGCKYVDAAGEFKQLRELVAKASELSTESAPNEPDGATKLLTHWFRAYLADPDENGFLRDKRHGLRWLAKEITRYGTPWDQEPRSGVFGRETTTGPTHYACAAHRPLKLKPEPPPPTREELAELDRQFAEGIRE